MKDVRAMTQNGAGSGSEKASRTGLEPWRILTKAQRKSVAKPGTLAYAAKRFRLAPAGA